MQIKPTLLDGCFELQPELFKDLRGGFVKVFNKDIFENHALQVKWLEEFYSVSNKNVIRGMHFQLPPYAVDKLVYCVNGSVLDAVLDLRHGSVTYGKHIVLELSSKLGNMIYIPKGMAHGFRALVDNTILVYKVSDVYHKELDCGVRWNSCGIDWQLSSGSVITSNRDNDFVTLNNFKTPFQYDKK